MMTTEISLMQMNKLMDITKANINVNDYNVVFVNLTSILNTLFYESIMDELKERDKLKEYVDKMQVLFKNNLMAMHRSHIRYYFYFSSKASRNKKYYDLWDSYINKYKFVFPMHAIYEMFIDSVKKLSKGFNNITIIDTEDIETAIIPWYYAKHHSIQKDKALIISRDLLDFINIRKGFHLFDSTQLFKSLENHTSKKISCVPKELISYYLYLLPIDKHSYAPPLIRAGKKNSVRYIISILNEGIDSAEIFRTKAFTIFDFDKFIADENIVLQF